MKNLQYLLLATVLLLFSKTIAAQDVTILHYTFSIKVFENTDSIIGKATINLKKSQGIKNIYLDFKSGKQPHPLKVKFARNLATKKFISCVHKDDVLALKVPENDTTLTIEINYAGIPENGLIIGKNMFGSRTWFADNWPNRASWWLPCLDDPKSKAPISWIVEAPNKYYVVANGDTTPTKSMKVSKNKDSSIVWTYHFSKPIPMKVAAIGIANFHYHTRSSGNEAKTPVYNFSYPQTYEKHLDKFFKAADILAYFDSLIAPYPFKQLYNVQSTTMFGGMENAGCIFYDEKTIEAYKNNEALMAHEIAHQWFGNSVTEKSFAHLWLSEGFATFFENYYIRSHYGEDSFNNRIVADHKKVQEAIANEALPVVNFTTKTMSLLNAYSYEKGGLFLEALRRKLGEEVFFKAIRTFYSTYQYSSADTDDFKKIMEQTAGINLDQDFQQWLYSTELPNLQ